jgi:hypothetical protein
LGVTTLNNAATVYGPLTANNNLNVSGVTTLSNAATVYGPLTANSNLNVSGVTTLSNAATVYGPLTANSNLTVNTTISASNITACNLVYSGNGQRGDVIVTIPNQLQSDWSQSNTSTVDFIKNKPTIKNTQWLDTSNGIYYTSNVGIGTNNLQSKFQIAGDEYIISSNVDIYTSIELPPPKATNWVYVGNQYYSSITNESCRFGDFGAGTYYTWASDNSDTSKLFKSKLTAPLERQVDGQNVYYYHSSYQWAQNTERNDFYIVLSSPVAIVPTGFSIVPTQFCWGIPHKFTNTEGVLGGVLELLGLIKIFTSPTSVPWMNRTFLSIAGATDMIDSYST